jgi:lysophospholipase L1-like esterase
MLFLLTALKSGFSIGSFTFKPVNILSDVVKKPKPLALISTTPKEKIALSKKELKLFKRGRLNRDSLMLVMEKDERISDFRTDSLDVLGRFFSSLSAAEHNKKRVRIAWFGDSMIEGDLITSTVRNIMQSEFGGSGVGFVPILTSVAGFRKTIDQSSSSDWQTVSVLKPRRGLFPGISGQVYVPNASHNAATASWASFNAPAAENKNTLQSIKLYYGHSPNGFINYALDGKPFKDTLKGRELVNEEILSAKPGSRQLKASFKGDSLTVFGISDESESGVLVDNLSLRGNSGTPMQAIPEKVLKEFNKYLKYDLIVLQYGTNVAAGADTNMVWYERGMIKVINRLKRNFPQADILLISVGDKSYKENMQFVTQPNIPVLVETQRRIARHTGIAFWNLFQAMGGPNSMVKMVESPVPLANKDYTHLNFRGAAKIGKIIGNNLLNEYHLYEQKRQ